MAHDENGRVHDEAYTKGFRDGVESTARRMTESEAYSPHVNNKAISIIQQEDGNWVGEMNKFGNVVRVREGKPEDALVKLLTHDGV